MTWVRRPRGAVLRLAALCAGSLLGAAPVAAGRSRRRPSRCRSPTTTAVLSDGLVSRTWAFALGGGVTTTSLRSGSRELSAAVLARTSASTSTRSRRRRRWVGRCCRSPPARSRPTRRARTRDPASKLTFRYALADSAPDDRRRRADARRLTARGLGSPRDDDRRWSTGPGGRPHRAVLARRAHAGRIPDERRRTGHRLPRRLGLARRLPPRSSASPGPSTTRARPRASTTAPARAGSSSPSGAAAPPVASAARQAVGPGPESIPAATCSTSVRCDRPADRRRLQPPREPGLPGAGPAAQRAARRHALPRSGVHGRVRAPRAGQHRLRRAHTRWWIHPDGFDWDCGICDREFVEVSS